MRPVPSLRGEPEAWQARTDLPWHWRPGKSPTDIAMVSLHRSPISDQALVGAVHGAIKLGEAAGFSDEHSLDRLAAIRDMCEGASYEEIEDEYGREHADAAAHVVGSFFGKIFKTVKKVATPVVKAVTSPIARKAIQFIPGVGPVASSALDVASPALRAMVSKGQHLPPAQRPAYQAALRSVPQVPRPGMARGAAPHRHAMFFTGPPIPL